MFHSLWRTRVRHCICAEIATTAKRPTGGARWRHRDVLARVCNDRMADNDLSVFRGSARFDSGDCSAECDSVRHRRRCCAAILLASARIKGFSCDTCTASSIGTDAREFIVRDAERSCAARKAASEPQEQRELARAVKDDCIASQRYRSKRHCRSMFVDCKQWHWPKKADCAIAD